MNRLHLAGRGEEMAGNPLGGGGVLHERRMAAVHGQHAHAGVCGGLLHRQFRVRVLLRLLCGERGVLHMRIQFYSWLGRMMNDFEPVAHGFNGVQLGAVRQRRADRGNRRNRQQAGTDPHQQLFSNHGNSFKGLLISWQSRENIRRAVVNYRTGRCQNMKRKL